MIALYLVSAALAYILNLVMLQITKAHSLNYAKQYLRPPVRLPVHFFDDSTRRRYYKPYHL